MTTTHPSPSLRSVSTRLEVVPVAGLAGAEIHGVNLAAPLPDEEVAAVRAALLEWKVVFFRDQHIDPHRQIAFGRRFGAVTPAHPTLEPLEGHPEVLALSTDDYGSAAEAGIFVENLWHTDVTFVHNPPLGSILRAVTVPPHGGDTAWSNLVAAYESLSPSLRGYVEGLRAVHRNRIPLEAGSGAGISLRDRFTATDFEAVHPVVRVHPETEERALFVNPQFTTHIVGLRNRESRRLLELLYEAIADPRVSVRFHWEPGSIAFWDNRATAHLASFDYVPPAKRIMHRITLAGDVPVGVDGRPSESIAGGGFA